jgi:hypothetical protein
MASGDALASKLSRVPTISWIENIRGRTPWRLRRLICFEALLLKFQGLAILRDSPHDLFGRAIGNRSVDF